MKIVIFGPQGSGKGTQAQALSKKLNIPQVTMGDLLRAEIKEQSAIGKQIQEIINQGKLVADDTTLAVLKNRLGQADCQSGFILDGFPRNLEQAASLDKLADITSALEIWIPDSDVISRIRDRRTCSKCQTIFHLVSSPPKQAGVCDNCGGELIVRDDDQEDAIKQRLVIYHQQTEPLIEYYQAQGKLIKIDGQPSIAEVNQEVFKKLNV